MSVIHPYTLFHFTNEISILKDIIEKGLRFSYCFEEFSNNVGIALPMICFCDIPLLRTLEHRQKYGDFMIGIDKKFLRGHMKYVLNPVAYKDSLFLRSFSPETLNAKFEIINNAYYNFLRKALESYNNQDIAIEEIFNQDKELHYKSDCVTIAKCSFLYELAFSKLYSFYETINDIKIERSNYDEREWRCVNYISQNENNNHWRWITGIKKVDYDKIKATLQKKLHQDKDAYLTFSPEDICNAINFIVVKSKNQIPTIIDFIINTTTIFGYSNISIEQRQLLITKITSFEDIEKNF